MLASWDLVTSDREWAWIVAHIEHLLRMDEEQVKTFSKLLNEDRSKISVIDLIEAQGEARGKARLLNYMVKKGRITLDEARNDLRQMVADGLLDKMELKRALKILNSGC